MCGYSRSQCCCGGKLTGWSAVVPRPFKPYSTALASIAAATGSKRAPDCRSSRWTNPRPTKSTSPAPTPVGISIMTFCCSPSPRPARIAAPRRNLRFSASSSRSSMKRTGNKEKRQNSIKCDAFECIPRRCTWSLSVTTCSGLYLDGLATKLPRKKAHGHDQAYMHTHARVYTPSRSSWWAPTLCNSPGSFS